MELNEFSYEKHFCTNVVLNQPFRVLNVYRNRYNMVQLHSACKIQIEIGHWSSGYTFEYLKKIKVFKKCLRIKIF